MSPKTVKAHEPKWGREAMNHLTDKALGGYLVHGYRIEMKPDGDLGGGLKERGEAGRGADKNVGLNQKSIQNIKK